MAIFKHRIIRKQIVDLSSSDGNAFHLLATAINLAPQYGLNADMVIREMTCGNYDNLITVFDKYFGNEMDLAHNIVIGGDDEELMEIEEVLEQISIKEDEARNTKKNIEDNQYLSQAKLRLMSHPFDKTEEEADKVIRDYCKQKYNRGK